MKYQFKALLRVSHCLFLLFLLRVPCGYAKNTQALPQPLKVRVLLAESADVACSDRWTIATSAGFFLTDLFSSTTTLQCHNNELHVAVKKGFFYLNGKRFLKKQFVVHAREGLLSFNRNFYKGSFLFVLDVQNRVQIINCVDLEHYIFAVLRSESWPGWPLEVNKVFAVAIRSYVIAKIREVKKSKRLFHIKSTKIHQTYNGHRFEKRNNTVLHKAVDQTRGMFLAYDDKPIVAMFDSCCGGIIPSKVEGVDFKKAPYLARDYPCEHCKRCKIYSWQVAYDIATWTKLLRAACPKLKKIRGITIARRDEAGLIQEITVQDSRTTFSLTGKQLYSLLDAVKSFSFSIHKKGKDILLSGRGYGHHLGLCQWGAREMVRDGWNYNKILKFYYPGVTFVRLV